MYIKDGKIESGYQLIKADGSISFNAPKEDWITEGWEEYNPDFSNPKPAKDIREEIYRECEDFYKTAILQVNFKNQLTWIPLITRVAYKSVLEDLKGIGETSVIWKGEELGIDEALDMLKKVNIYEYNCKQVFDRHCQNIKKKPTSELESYDYTVGYRESLSL